MRTIESVMDAFTNSEELFEDIRATLREIDPDFQREDERYLSACVKLQNEAGNRIIPSAKAYLQAHKLGFVACVIYIGWQGFQQNVDIFNNPSSASALQQCEFEELHKEKELGSLPCVKEAWRTINEFHNAPRKLPEEQVNQVNKATEDILSVFAYLETSIYKIAHYFGFLFADRFLYYVIPGYQCNNANTFHYRNAVSNYLNIDLSKIE